MKCSGLSICMRAERDISVTRTKPGHQEAVQEIPSLHLLNTNKRWPNKPTTSSTSSLVQQHFPTTPFKHKQNTSHTNHFPSTTELAVDRYKHFRWTPRTAWLTFAYVVIGPTIMGYFAYTTDVSQISCLHVHHFSFWSVCGVVVRCRGSIGQTGTGKGCEDASAVNDGVRCLQALREHKSN